ncbi:MAG: Fe-S protein assembly co-chaperone HscB [Deltaproteobacteria bacterium]
MDCWSCGAERGDALFCTTCKILQPESKKEDWFAALGVEKKFSIDTKALAKAFRTRSVKVHPDRFAQKSAVERRLAVQHTANLNDAYRTLSDPQKRAEYLMKLEGVEIGGEEQRTNDPEFLMAMMELQEEADGAKTAAAIDAMLERVGGIRSGELDKVRAYFDDGVGEREQIVRALDALRYYMRLVERLEARREEAS